MSQIQTPTEEEREKDTYWSILKNGFPTSLSIISEIIILTINYSRISDSAAKAGLGLSGVLVHALGGAFVVGFDYGYAIFASRAFGAKNYEKYKLYFVQGLTNLIGVLVIFVVISLGSYQVSIIAGQEQQVSLHTYQFIVYILPGYVCFYMSHFVRMFINSQDIYSPNFYVDAAAIVLHIIISWVMSFFTADKTLIIISTNITLICYFLIILFIQRTYTPWKLSFQLLKVPNYFSDYKHFLTQCCFIGIPYALMVFIFQVVALFVGSFKNTPQTAGHVIVTNILMMMVSPYLGFGLFMSTRIGYYVGKNNWHAIMDLLTKIIKFSLFISYILFALLMLFLDPVVNFYSTDQQVKFYMVPALKFLGVTFVVDVLQNIGSQFYKALGYGPWITKVYIISFYIVGFGSIYILSKFLSNQIISVWAGLMIGCIALSSFCGAKLLTIDMPSLVQQLHNKVKNKGEGLQIPLHDIAHL